VAIGQPGRREKDFVYSRGVGRGEPDYATISNQTNMNQKYLSKLVVTSCVILAGCGGGGTGGSQGSSTPPGPVITDSVLMSSGTAANALVVTVNHAGYLRAYGTGTNQSLTLGLGSTPLTGNANSATANGWMPASDIFVSGNATLDLNKDKKTYSLQVQGAGTSASDSTLTLVSNLVAPTTTSLAGTYGIGGNPTITIADTSLNGSYGFDCTWTANLTPQNNTIDVTNIQFATTTSALNPGLIPCPYAGQTYTGTAFLMGPSDAYPKGVFVIQWDDGGVNTPTQIHEGYFPRQ
jgi:hypothetical protein